MSTCSTATELTDSELTEHVRQGGALGRSAFAELYGRHGARLLAFLSSRCPAGYDAADVAQDVWLKAYRKWHQFDGQNLIAWLFTIGRNTLLDMMRRPRLKQADDNPEVPAPQLPPDDDERLAALRECLAAIDSQFVSTFVKVKIHGESVDSLAAGQGVSPNTIYTRVHRAGKQLAECIERRLG